MGKIERRCKFEVAGCRPRKVCAEFRVGSEILDNYNQFAILRFGELALFSVEIFGSWF
jgi:hypothetical protein